jgi:hypothetical protein
MKPFNFWLFGGSVLYTGLVLSVIGYDVLKDLSYALHLLLLRDAAVAQGKTN